MLGAANMVGGYFLWFVIIGGIVWYVHTKRRRFQADLEDAIGGATRVLVVRAKHAPKVIAQFEWAGWMLHEQQVQWHWGLRPWVVLTFVKETEEEPTPQSLPLDA